MTLTKEPGTWTYEDLYSLPEDGGRYEIIEGELFELPSTTWNHATAIMNLLLLLGPVVRGRGGQLVTAPVDVFFPSADPVQPDILAILPGWKGRLPQRGPEGAPDFVVEVLTWSHRGHDLLRKRALYAYAGVREYWIVDPRSRTVDVLTLDRDAFHTAQRAAGDDRVVSPLLVGAEFSLAEIFAGVGEDES